MATIHFTPLQPGVGAVQSDTESIDIRPMDFQEKKALANRIAGLSKEAHLEIFFLLCKYVAQGQYTLTRNGAFFNINNLPHRVLKDLSGLVDFCCRNEERLELTHKDKKDILLSMKKEENSSDESESSSSEDVESSSEESSSEESSSEESLPTPKPSKAKVPARKNLVAKSIRGRKHKAT